MDPSHMITFPDDSPQSKLKSLLFYVSSGYKIVHSILCKKKKNFIASQEGKIIIWKETYTLLTRREDVNRM